MGMANGPTTSHRQWLLRETGHITATLPSCRRASSPVKRCAAHVPAAFHARNTQAPGHCGCVVRSSKAKENVRARVWAKLVLFRVYKNTKGYIDQPLKCPGRDHPQTLQGCARLRLVLCPESRAAMRRRSRAGAKSPNVQAPKAAARKSRIAPKAGHPRITSTASVETEVARLARELKSSAGAAVHYAEVLQIIQPFGLRSTDRAESDLPDSAARLCPTPRSQTSGGPLMEPIAWPPVMA